MDGEAMQQCAAAQAEKLPGSELTHPFGEDWDVYKVRGKVFMLQTAITGEEIVTLKCAPDDARSLQEQYAGIVPGYHMNKRHWITLSPGGLEAEFVRELVTDSYLLVVETLPRARRPVDPQTFLAAEGGTGTSSTDGPAT